MRSLEVSSGGFSAPCTVDMVLESVDAVLGVVDLLGEGSREDSTDAAIAEKIVYEQSMCLRTYSDEALCAGCCFMLKRLKKIALNWYVTFALPAIADKRSPTSIHLGLC
jgi:hypothetical protein